MKKRCETCKWWKRGDLLGKVGNMGQCTWLLRVGGELSLPDVPFWATQIAFQTISWEGKSCGAWKAASKRQAKENSAT